MRSSASSVANGLAWVVVFGLMLLGMAIWLVRTLANLHQDAPTWGVEVFGARMPGHGSPEQRAAMLLEREDLVPPLRFYRWCGIVLALMGAAGFTWQRWD